MLLALPSWTRARLLFTPFAALLATAAALFAQTPSAADGFEPSVDGNVYAVATQPDGRLLIAGQFTSVRQPDGALFARSNLARLNADGTVDASFDPSPNGAVRALVQQPDGLIVIGGEFTALRPNGGASVDRGRLARLRVDGTPDTLALNIGGAAVPGGGTLTARVNALLLQPDGSLVVGGEFGSVQPGLLTVIFTRRNLFRVTPAGAVDANFDPRPSSTVLALAQHVDGKIVVAGGFTSLQPTGDSAATTRNRIARLNANGRVDSEFNPNANNAVAALLVQRDGKIVLGGNFTTLQPVGNDSAANRGSLARLNVDGTLDSEFFPNTNGSVAALALQPDGAIVVGGSFNVVWGRGTASAGRSNAARFNPDGTLDGNFNPGLNAQVNAFAFQADGKIVLGGNFTRAQPGGGAVAFTRNRVARLNTDGSLDATFELQPGGRVLATAVQADGKVVIGGSFTSVGGATHNFLARLNADGSVDSAYNPNLNGRVYALAYEAGSGKTIVGGAFTTIGGETRNHLARLNANGTIDSEFNPNIDGDVGAIVVQSDGRILVGGTFNSVQPIGSSAVTFRTNLLRLTPTGTLDTTFDPGPNAGVSALALQSDGKILVGGNFSAFAANAGANVTARNFIGRLTPDGSVDTAFSPALNARVSAIVVQSDQKIVATGAFTSVLPTNATAGVTRNYILRFNADGTLDTAYDPKANAPVLAAALQSDGKLVIGGAFTTLQPNGAADWTLRKYAARLNADGTVDSAFNLDLDEAGGNRVDSLRVLSDNRILIGGQFASLQPAGTGTRIARRTLARLNANGTVDTSFDPGAGGQTTGQINAFAVQPDNKVIAVGSFSDLGGAKSSNIARFNPEGTADNTFSPSFTSDGAINAIALRPNVAATPTQLGGFAWLTREGTLRSGFTASANARLSGTISAAAVQADGRLLLGGAFTNLSNATGGNLARFSASGTLDTSFNPNPNGAVTGIILQSDGRIVIVGSFTVVAGVVRNRIARLNADGSLDSTYDPNASARINAAVLESDGRIVVGGAFTTFSPNGGATVNRTYLACVNADGTVDANYNPSPNLTVNALALQADGKVVAGGLFSAVQPNGTSTATTRQFVARFNTDGTLDQNFNPNPNAGVNALGALPNGQFVLGGSFTALQPNATGTIHTRNNLARINSDGALDESFNPNANGAVTALALQSDGSVVVAGDFTTVQPGGTGAAVTRNGLVRLLPTGALDVNFNPDVNGAVAGLVARPDGTLLVTGSFTGLQTNGALVVGGAFQTIGGVGSRNLATLNADGSVNTTFQPNPNGAVSALIVQPDGKIVVGGAFTTIAGATRNRIARFNADGTLDAGFVPGGITAGVSALAYQPDGKILVAFGSNGLIRLNPDGTADSGFNVNAGATQGYGAIFVQSDGQILAVANFTVVAGSSQPGSSLLRFNPDGSRDTAFTPLSGSASNAVAGLTVQTDGRIIVRGLFDAGRALVRLNRDGSIDPSFAPATGVNAPTTGAVSALALQSDGRLLIGGRFTSVGGLPRVGLARLAPTGPAVQTLGVSADRRTVTWLRSGTAGELAAARFELSTDRTNWTALGAGTRVAGTSNWQVTGLSLPVSGLFYIRARGIVPTSGGGSSGVYETVREFNYTSPVGGTTSTATNVIAATAAAAVNSAAVWTIDDVTGVATLTGVQTIGSISVTNTVEIVVPGTSAAIAGGTSRLVNLSTRSRVTAGSPLVVGFAVAGTESRAILVRGIGPTLGAFGVTDAVAATRLQILDSTGRAVVTTEGWDAPAAGNLISTFAQTGAFPLPGRSGDSAAVITLAPGTYTLQVGPAASAAAGGIALAEVYDAGGANAASRLLNVSTRGNAAAGGNALISGFVIAGNASKRVLLRGAGPSLAQFGVTGVLADPILSLHASDGRTLGANDNWVAGAAPLTAATLSVGAFALDAGSRDAAVLATLPPGAYTVQVAPATDANATGTALLEIYELP